MDVMQHVLVSTSRGDPYKELWRCVWKAKVPGKVSICAWRACNNLLPTRDRLLTKGYDGPRHCLFCNYRIEDASHLFCKCPIASTILQAAPFNFQNTILPSLNFKEWMLECAHTLPPDIFAKLLMIIWAIWKNRNNFLWNGTEQSAQDILLSSFTWLDEFQKARNTSQPSPVKQQRQRWKPAENGAFKLNVDAAFLSNQIRGGLGGVLPNAFGKFVAAFATPIAHTASPKQCELYAISAGLDLLASLHIQNVVVESDCIEVIAEALCPDHSLLANGGLVDDIKRAVRNIPSVQIQYAPRSCNMVAHRLAGIGFEAQFRTVWLDHMPSCIIDVLNANCKHLN
ncbi:hypothetical protein ABKV19_008339 [Rosa sericea]